jgi:hypothetical protein
LEYAKEKHNESKSPTPYSNDIREGRKSEDALENKAVT